MKSNTTQANFQDKSLPFCMHQDPCTVACMEEKHHRTRGNIFNWWYKSISMGVFIEFLSLCVTVYFLF
jgi:hypothetical protein